jgi:ABC-type spermidine/putrescine transport system permease subunit I
LLLPAILFFALFYLLPVGRLLTLSVWANGPTLAPFAEIFHRPEFVIILYNTLHVAIGATLLALLLGYPVAYYLSRSSGSVAALGMLFVAFPLLTSVLVRSYAWTALLGRTGMLNVALMHVGLIRAPLPLIFNRLGVYIGTVHAFLPLGIIPLYTAMRRIDRNLLKAAESLGASRLQTFLKIYFPLTLPGIAAGGLMVFIASASTFVTPVLLGGPKDLMIANLIGDQIEQTLNWPLGAALSVILLLVSVAGVTLYFVVARTEDGDEQAIR